MIAGLVGAVTGIGNLSAIAVSISATVSSIRRHMPNLNVVAFLQIFAVVGAWIGAQAQVRAKGAFHLDRMAAEVEAVYRDVLQSP